MSCRYTSQHPTVIPCSPKLAHSYCFCTSKGGEELKPRSVGFTDRVRGRAGCSPAPIDSDKLRAWDFGWDNATLPRLESCTEIHGLVKCLGGAATFPVLSPRGKSRSFMLYGSQTTHTEVSRAAQNKDVRSWGLETSTYTGSVGILLNL